MRKIILLMLILTFGLLYSCVKQSKDGSAIMTSKEEGIRKIELLLGTPENLRSAEENALIQQVGTIYFERTVIKEERFVFTISEEEWNDLGIDKAYFYKIEKEIEDTNNYIDTMTVTTKQGFFDAFMETKERYTRK